MVHSVQSSTLNAPVGHAETASSMSARWHSGGSGSAKVDSRSLALDAQNAVEERSASS
jgi:hypothetical protein